MEDIQPQVLPKEEDIQEQVLLKEVVIQVQVVPMYLVGQEEPLQAPHSLPYPSTKTQHLLMLLTMVWEEPQ